MVQPLRVAIAGLGTVGAGTVALLRRNAALIEHQTGRKIDIVAVSARDRSRARLIDVSGVPWHDDPVAMAAAPGIDVVVELIGGSDGVARKVVTTALEQGRHVVTANKALLAHHGNEIAKLAEAKKVSLGFEAAVARHPDPQSAARGACRQSRAAGLRHPQRHLQLHPVADA